jgi:hypothetical protein
METSEAIKLNQEVFKNIQISSQEIMIIKSLDKFYEDTNNINLFISIINPNTLSLSSISIRLIDHFVTKYSKTNKINYKLKENDVEQTFNVHTSYKQQLKAFQKRHFDPFSRGDRVPYFMGDSCIITTIGQLNFFKWFISKKIYNYIMDNQYNIENDMNRRNKNDHNKLKKETKPKKILKHNIIIPQTSNHCYSNFKPILLSEPKKEKIVVSFTF